MYYPEQERLVTADIVNWSMNEKETVLNHFFFAPKRKQAWLDPVSMDFLIGYF